MKDLSEQNKPAKANLNKPVSFKRRMRRKLHQLWQKPFFKICAGALVMIGVLMAAESVNYFNQSRKITDNLDINTTSTLNNNDNDRNSSGVTNETQSQNALTGPAGTLISAQSTISTTTQGVPIIQNQLNCQKFKTSPSKIKDLKFTVWKKAYDSEATLFNLNNSQTTGQYVTTGKNVSSENNISALDLEHSWCLLGENDAQNLQIFLANMNNARKTSDKTKLASLWQNNNLIREKNKY